MDPEETINGLLITCVQLLVSHIRQKLPDLRSKLSTLIGQTEYELAQYGDPAFIGTAHKVCISRLFKHWVRKTERFSLGILGLEATYHVCDAVYIIHRRHFLRNIDQRTVNIGPT